MSDQVWMLVGMLDDIEVEMSVHLSYAGAAAHAAGVTEELAVENNEDANEATEWGISLEEHLNKLFKSTPNRAYVEHQDINSGIEWRIKKVRVRKA